MKNSLLLIDGHSILNRAFYAIPLLSNSKGVYTNAVYGFLNIILKAFDEVNPDHIAVAFDLPEPTFRHEIYGAYKGKRKKMPQELLCQVPLAKKVLEAMNIRILEQPGFEADDLIGSAAFLSQKAGMTAVILSGDRDLLQLVTENVTLMLPKTVKGSTMVERFTPERVREVYRVGPEKIVDLKSMMGDSSDNVPGLPNVGEKTAVNLILKYGSLEKTHENYVEIKPCRAMEAFRDHYDLALLSKKLVTIKTDIDFPGFPESFKTGNFYNNAAYGIFKELEFKNFYPRFVKSKVNSVGEIKINIIGSRTQAESSIKNACCCKKVGFYMDTDDDKISGLALSYEGGCCFIAAGDSISEDYLVRGLKKILKNAELMPTFSFKDQLNVLMIDDSDKIFDCKIAAYLTDPLRSEYSYEYVSLEFAGTNLPSPEEIVGGKITKKTEFTREQRAKTAVYTAYSAYISEKGLKEKLSEYNMENLFYKIEMPFVYTLSSMERAGIRLNTEELARFSEELRKQTVLLEENIYEQAGETFNIQSPKQLGHVLFEKLKLPHAKKTKSGYSTAADILEKLAYDFPIVENILKYRQLSKLKSTYADVLGSYVRKDGRIHTKFLQTVTATGRISSTQPNLQNIPVRTDLGRKIRRAFIPEAECMFADADYSQIELRVLAHMSNDNKLIEAYKKDDDIHRITASEVFQVPLDEVTPEQRRNAKAVNFGIIYGISAFGLSQDLSISRQEAKTYIEKYFNTYPQIRKYLDKTVEKALKKGYTTTLFGRRRPIPELKSSNYVQRSFGERAAMNSPIQGSAADIIKIAMNKVRAGLKRENLNARLILQVHDELLVECGKSEIETVKKILKEEMEGAVKLSVSLAAEVNAGENWDEAH